MLLIAAGLLAPWLYEPVQADIIDDLKKNIEQKNIEIKKLEEDEKKYRLELADKQKMGKTLVQEVKRIQTNIKKLQNDVAITQRQIHRAELEITEVAYKISEKEKAMEKIKNGLANLINIFHHTKQNSAIELFLRQPTFSEFFHILDSNASIQKKMTISLANLRVLRSDLEEQKNTQTVKRDEAKDLHNLLQQRQEVLVSQKNEQGQLLNITKQQEKLYQQLLQEQERKRQQLDQEIHDIEEKIRITIDQSSLPQRGKGVIGWPLPEVSKESCFSSLMAVKNCITQFFGYTQFAAAGAYNGKGHNGVDFRAEIGTPIFTADSGIIEATGDTDIGCKGASYGKWILIHHPNNISTMYAHLSQVNVSSGQQVTRGDRIALSGKTGYATGPHLHFGLFATMGVSIQSIRSKVCGRMMTLPVAALNAYLNPLDYL